MWRPKGETLSTIDELYHTTTFAILSFLIVVFVIGFWAVFVSLEVSVSYLCLSVFDRAWFGAQIVSAEMPFAEEIAACTDFDRHLIPPSIW